MANNRSQRSTSILKKRATSAVANVPIHSHNHDDDDDDDEKSNELSAYKQEKLAAGIRAADNHKYREAIKQFALIKPDTITSLYLAGCARLELKHYTQSQEAIVDFDKCFELLPESEFPPFSLELWYKRALAFHDIRKYDEAYEDFTEYISRSRALSEQGKSNLHRGLIGRGKNYQATYDLDLAMDDMNEANELSFEKNPYYLCCRASIHAENFDVKNALKDLERASDRGCYQDAEALFQRGKVLAELNRHNAALEDLTKALSLSGKPSEQSDICHHCGLSEYALNNKELAYQWFSRSLSLHPYNAQSYYRLGMLLSEKGQDKEALKNLNRANDLSPEQSDILRARANIYEHLGKLSDAANDRTRADKIDSTDLGIIKMLGQRIKTLRQEIDRTESSPRAHFELATAYHGMLNRKKNFKSIIEYYRHAISEYHATMETDTKTLYPQARALLIFCYLKLNELTEGHKLHVELYNILNKNKNAAYHWKEYLLDIESQMRSGKFEPHLDQYTVSKIISIELNRRKQNTDEEALQNDSEDHANNQLIFYKQLRLDLANLLLAINVLNLDNKYILFNVENEFQQINRILEAFVAGDTSVKNIETRLNTDTKTNMDMFRTANYDILSAKMRRFGNIGDLFDQMDVAQLVARHLCTRYHNQLLCIKTEDPTTNNDANVEKTPSDSSWSCCSSNKNDEHDNNDFTSVSRIIFEKNVIKKLATFAIAYIIAIFNRESIKVATDDVLPKKTALATKLVLTISRANVVIDGISLSSPYYANANIALDSASVAKILKHTQKTSGLQGTLPVRWNRYQFFRAPGIFYQLDEDGGRANYYGSDSQMRPEIYGYRLGTKEEVQVFEKNLDQRAK